MVTHPSTYHARGRVTSLIETNALRLSQAATKQGYCKWFCLVLSCPKVCVTFAVCCPWTNTHNSDNDDDENDESCHLKSSLVKTGLLFLQPQSLVQLIKANYRHRNHSRWVRIIQLGLLPDSSIDAWTHTHNHFMALFPGPPAWAGAGRNKLLLDFMVKWKITKADTPTIWLGGTPSGLISDPPPSFPHFYAGCPSCRNPPTLSWLRTGTKYAGLHT